MEALLAEGNDKIIVIGLAVMMGLLLVIIGIAAMGGGGKEKQRRVARVKNASRPIGGTVAAAAVNIRRDTSYSTNKALDALIRRVLPQPENMRNKLAQTGFKISLGKYLIACAIVAVVSFLLFLIPKMIPTAAAVLLGLLFGAALPYLTIKYLIGRRRNKFIHNFPEAIDLMVRGLKSGLPVTETIKVVGEETQDPTSTEFTTITESLRFGKKLDEALWEVSGRLDMQEFNFFTVTLSIQSETGGNLAETLENLSDVLRRRRQMKLKIKALAAEPRSSAYIIGSLPFVMLGLIFVLNTEYIMELFNDPRGNMMVAGGSVWFAIGIFAMWKMVRFEI